MITFEQNMDVNTYTCLTLSVCKRGPFYAASSLIKSSWNKLRAMFQVICCYKRTMCCHLLTSCSQCRAITCLFHLTAVWEETQWSWLTTMQYINAPHQSGRSPNVVALFLLQTLVAIWLLQLHDIIQMTPSYTWINNNRDKIDIRNHIMIYNSV